jgi:DNA-binding GntR family transcriptional regulator
MKIKSVADHTKQFVEKCIITGEFSPGRQIKEDEIASRLQISRPPVREAFKLLEAEGLVTRKPRRGVFVTEITKKDIWEIYTTKVALYGLATTLAIEKISQQELEKLESIVKSMEACVEKKPADLIRYQKLHEEFHFFLIEIAGHERLRKVVASLNNQVKRLSYKSLGDNEHLVVSCRYHRQIFEAIRSKDKEVALRMDREHILAGMKVVQKVFEKETERDIEKTIAREGAMNIPG